MNGPLDDSDVGYRAGGWWQTARLVLFALWLLGALVLLLLDPRRCFGPPLILLWVGVLAVFRLTEWALAHFARPRYVMALIALVLIVVVAFGRSQGKLFPGC